MEPPFCVDIDNASGERIIVTLIDINQHQRRDVIEYYLCS
jgi:hypothetical protein